MKRAHYISSKVYDHLLLGLGAGAGAGSAVRWWWPGTRSVSCLSGVSPLFMVVLQGCLCHTTSMLAWPLTHPFGWAYPQPHPHSPAWTSQGIPGLCPALDLGNTHLLLPQPSQLLPLTRQKLRGWLWAVIALLHLFFFFLIKSVIQEAKSTGCSFLQSRFSHLYQPH